MTSESAGVVGVLSLVERLRQQDGELADEAADCIDELERMLSRANALADAEQHKAQVAESRIEELERLLHDGAVELDHCRDVAGKVEDMERRAERAEASLAAEFDRGLEEGARRAARENEANKRRLNWAANELLACDYGDNPRNDEAAEGVVGWLVYGWRQQKIGMDERKRIYGSSINEAIDAEIP